MGEIVLHYFLIFLKNKWSYLIVLFLPTPWDVSPVSGYAPRGLGERKSPTRTEDQGPSVWVRRSVGLPPTPTPTSPWEADRACPSKSLSTLPI